MPSVIGEWIERQRMEAMRGINNSGPTLKPMLPLAQRMVEESAEREMPGSMMRGSDGAIFTGRGAPDDVAGVVHGNEMVVEEKMINDLGGPEETRDTLEKEREKRMYGNVRGFQTGTGSGTAAKPNYKSITNRAVKDLQNISAGESKAAETAGRVARQRLGGAQAAELGGFRQNLAQQNVDEGAARSAMALERIRQGSQTAGLEGDLAVEKSRAAERATSQLADVGLRGQQMEQQDEHFDRSMKLNEKQFDFTKSRQIAADQIGAGDFEGAAKTYADMGVTVDMTKLQDRDRAEKFNTAMDGVSTAMANGIGFENDTVQMQLQKAYAAQNPEVDLSKPENRERYDQWAKDTFKGMQIKSDPIAGPISSIQDDTIATWMQGSLPEGMTLDNYEYAGAKGVEAGRRAMITLMGPGGGMGFDEAGNLTVDTTNEAWAAVGLLNTDEFGNVTPRVGTTPEERDEIERKKAITGSSEFKDLETGRVMYKDGKKITKTGADTFIETAMTDADKVDQRIQSAAIGDEVTVNEKTYVKDRLGNAVELEDAFDFGTNGDRFSHNEAALNVGGEWVYFSGGEVFRVDRAVRGQDPRIAENNLGWPGGKLPRGTYRAKKIKIGEDADVPESAKGKEMLVFENIETGDKYLAPKDYSDDGHSYLTLALREEYGLK